MRKLPTILAFGFISITLWRVGQFADTRMYGGWPGWVFSIFIGMGVYLSAYYTRDSITIKDNGKEDKRSVNVKKWAWILLAFCVAGDGLFNMSEVWYTVKPAKTDILLIVATAVFGLFPTLAAAGFGALQGHVDRLPQPPVKVSLWLSIRRRLAAAIDGTQQKAPEEEHKAPVKHAKPPEETQKAPEVIEDTPEAPVLWRNIPAHDRYAIAAMNTKEIMGAYGIDERKAREWRTKARNNGYATVKS